MISQRLLGTTGIVLTRHRDCAMLPFADDVEADVRQSIARIEASPSIPHKNVRGFVHDVATGKLDEVT